MGQRSCTAWFWEALVMLYSSPAARLRDNTPPSDKRSVNQRCGSRGLRHARSAYALIALMVLLLPCAGGVYGQANVQGQWQTVPTTMPINPIHVSLMHNGKILVVAGSGNYPPNTSYQAAIWDPSNNSVAVQTLNWDMFCSGMITRCWSLRATIRRSFRLFQTKPARIRRSPRTPRRRRA